MHVRRTEVLPLRLHRMHLLRVKRPLRTLVKSLRDLQFAQIDRPCVLGRLTQGNISLLSRRLQNLVLLARNHSALIARLRSAVWVSVKGAAELPGSFRAGDCAFVAGARDEVVVATFASPGVGELCELVWAIFAAPLDAHGGMKKSEATGEQCCCCSGREVGVSCMVDDERQWKNLEHGMKVLHSPMLYMLHVNVSFSCKCVGAMILVLEMKLENQGSVGGPGWSFMLSILPVNEENDAALARFWCEHSRSCHGKICGSYCVVRVRLHSTPPE